MACPMAMPAKLRCSRFVRSTRRLSARNRFFKSLTVSLPRPSKRGMHFLGTLTRLLVSLWLGRQMYTCYRSQLMRAHRFDCGMT
jgi:hypothetical protein